MYPTSSLITAGVVLVIVAGAVRAQTTTSDSQKSTQEKQARAFHWVNRIPEKNAPHVKHGTYSSSIQGVPVGYYIYLPDEYHQAENSEKRYPVVYYLHGGRPGGEQVSVRIAKTFHDAISSGRVPPMIYVFVNGGIVSHYDYPENKSYGESTFIKELIPHIDTTYRTIARREGRGLEGFSQGGRGTARIAFKYPELFISAAPMGGGHSHEKFISEHDGVEETGLKFEAKNNTYDLAKAYLVKRDTFPVKILVAFGKKDFNYEANLEWMAYLKEIGIPFEHLIAGDAPHSAERCYDVLKDQVMLFHAKNFGLVK